MTAPVRVATSTIRSAPWRAHQVRASARISLPSASVLLTSTVLPLSWVMMSPGRIAPPLGMFSTAGTTVTRSIGSAELGDRRRRLEHGRAAGHVLLHQLHPGAGLIEMPPLSKVTPLPTKPRVGRRRLRLAGVAQHDQRRVLVRAGGDREQAADALRLELGAGRGSRPRPCRGRRRSPAPARRGRRGRARWRGGSGGRERGWPPRRRCGRSRRCRGGSSQAPMQRQRLDRAAGSSSSRLALEAVEAVVGEDRPGGQRRRRSLRLGAGRPRRSSGLEAARLRDRERRGDPGALGVEVVAVAEPDDEHPRRRRGRSTERLLKRDSTSSAPGAASRCRAGPRRRRGRSRAGRRRSPRGAMS